MDRERRCERGQVKDGAADPPGDSDGRGARIQSRSGQSIAWPHRSVKGDVSKSQITQKRSAL